MKKSLFQPNSKRFRYSLTLGCLLSLQETAIFGISDQFVFVGVGFFDVKLNNTIAGYGPLRPAVFQTMREIERILKPEGVLVVLNFNPLSFWVRYQFLWDKKMADSWSGHFIFRSRILDWLKLLNFEVTLSSKFNLDTVTSKQGKFINEGHSYFFTAYAIKAIKRRYNIIPLTPVKNANIRLTLVNSLNSVAQKEKHD